MIGLLVVVVVVVGVVTGVVAFARRPCAVLVVVDAVPAGPVTGVIVVVPDTVELPPVLDAEVDVDAVCAVDAELDEENNVPDCESVIVGIVTPSVLRVVCPEVTPPGDVSRLL
jgi:hypothetical protein